MQIITLGTSHGGAEKGRACSGTLLEINGYYYLFDCGGDIECKICNLDIDFSKIKAVFISHMHEDHVGNLSAIAKRFSCYIKTGEHIDIFMPEQNGIAAFESWLSALHFPDLSKLNFHLIKDEVIYTDENISVSNIPNDHMSRWNAPSFSFLINADSKLIMYSGDLSCDFHDYPQVLFEKLFDAVVCELVHFNVENNLETILKTKTKKLIFTHMSTRNIPLIEAVIHKFPFSVEIAKDCSLYEI